jgi:hypothetical protein
MYALKRVSANSERERVRIPELWLCPLFSFDATTVKLWNSQGNFVIDVLIQDTHDNNGERSKRKIEENNVSIVENILAVKVGVNLVPEEGKHPDNVLLLLAHRDQHMKEDIIELTL